jgi:hypothetical protein
MSSEVPPYRVGAAAVALYALALLAAGKLGWQHLGLALLFWACVTRHAPARRFVRGWWPMIAFWLAYDGMRLFSGALFTRVALRAPVEWELRLFPAPGGTIWPFYLTRWLAAHHEQLGPRLLEGFLTAVYYTQLSGIPLVLLTLWVRGEEALFRRLVWSFTALHLFTLPLYLGYPAAPPWWIYDNGFVSPTDASSMPRLGAGSALHLLFRLSPNRFAAIPSLHGAYPVLLTLVLAACRARPLRIGLAAAYAVSMLLACVFLNQHYIVDLAIGAALAAAALAVGPRLEAIAAARSRR